MQRPVALVYRLAQGFIAGTPCIDIGGALDAIPKLSFPSTSLLLAYPAGVDGGVQVDGHDSGARGC